MVSTCSSLSNANDAHTNDADAVIDADAAIDDNTNADDGNDAKPAKQTLLRKPKMILFRSSHARNAAGSLTFSGLSSELLLVNFG
jgi:hypothetical protein